MQLLNVSYGASGAFAISLWVKPTTLDGAALAYLYSHNASSPGPQPVKPNQVLLMYTRLLTTECKMHVNQSQQLYSPGCAQHAALT